MRRAWEGRQDGDGRRATIVADAFQRMMLRNTTPEEAYQEVVTKYNKVLAKTP